jgi:hypothetical protein
MALQAEPPPELFEGDRLAAAREDLPRCGDVDEVLEFFEPGSVLDRDQDREVLASLSKDDPLAPDDPAQGLRELLLRS